MVFEIQELYPNAPLFRKSTKLKNSTLNRFPKLARVPRCLRALSFLQSFGIWTRSMRKRCEIRLQMRSIFFLILHGEKYGGKKVDCFRKTNSFKPALPVHEISLNVELYEAHELFWRSINSTVNKVRINTALRPCPHVYGYFRIRNFFFPDSKISPSTRSVFWRAYLFCSGFAVEFVVYVWTVAVSATKKLRIRKYPYTCGRGLKKTQIFVVFSFGRFVRSSSPETN